MKERGFTLIELMIVVAIIAIIAAIAIPNLMRARLAANESSAISSLRTLSSAQETFRSRVLKDQDADGMGEYGGPGELGGMAMLPPALSRQADPPFIDNQLAGGQKSGYTFRIAIGWGTAATAGTGAGGLGLNCCPTVTLAVQASEVFYYASAWPIDYGRSGNRTFCIDASGVLRASDLVNGIDVAMCSFMTGTGVNLWPVVGG